ncbi:hypothetical protein HUA76_10460 [Myxococcus sp. CA056]|uniref:hypothetical protein n=1 Tax=unclassified Myxococcus TaxID=2648731 RepID=UPI00157AEF71|nr:MULTISPECIES: hypothetical protein [unclassified Myxococcus]NTX11210.1 hypothetical protein [Myxococcus sp. CA056]NTX34692.1 hypothetical protein [Myxococcus sp. CA033]
MNGNGRGGNELVERQRHVDHRITRGMDDREQVEQTADRIRDELLLTLEELDRRRGRALDVRYQVKQHTGALVAAGAVAMVLVGAGVGLAIYRSRHRGEVLRKKRRKALQRAWAHPDQLASSADQRPVGAELGRKLILIFATTLATAVAKNSVKTLVPARQAPSPASLEK